MPVHPTEEPPMRRTVPAAAACLTLLAACGGGDSSTAPSDNADFTGCAISKGSFINVSSCGV
jgi:hypothetical protein